jgi:hypothetical protein
MRSISACLVFILLACTHVRAQQVSSHAQSLVETIQQLRKVGLPSPDEVDNTPAKVPGLLRQLNQELKSLIVDDLNDSTRYGAPNEEELLEQLRAAGWNELPNHKWNAYGEIRQIKFDWKTEYQPGILIVSPQLWIPCGGGDPDSVIYVFQGNARHWDLVLSTDSDFDAQDQRDESGIQYAISPPDSRGKWFLVLARVPPSCSGRDDVVRYEVLDPGPKAAEPTVLLTHQEKLVGDFNPPFLLDVHEDWFAITEGKLRRLDRGLGVTISRYQVRENQVQRIAPLALTPQDFLDQWVQLPWADASQWSKGPSGDALKEWHSELSGLLPDSTEIRSVHLCSGSEAGDAGWLVEVWIDQQLNPSTKKQNLYIEIAKTGGVFHISQVRDVHPAGCQGKTPLMPFMEHNLPAW